MSKKREFARILSVELEDFALTQRISDRDYELFDAAAHRLLEISKGKKQNAGKEKNSKKLSS